MRPRGLDKTVRLQSRTVYRGVVFIWAAKPRVKTTPWTPRMMAGNPVTSTGFHYLLRTTRPKSSQTFPAAITSFDAYLYWTLASRYQ